MFPWKAPTDPSIGVTHPGTTHLNEENSRRSPKPASAVFPAEAPDILAQRQDTHYNPTEVPNLEKLWTQQRKLLIYATKFVVFIRSEMPSLKSLHMTSAGESVEEREHSHTADGNGKWCDHYGKQYGVSLTIKKSATKWSSNPTSGHISRNDDNSNLKRYMHPSIHSSGIHNC